MDKKSHRSKRKRSQKRQKLYKMKGCSRKSCKNVGGTSHSNLANKPNINGSNHALPSAGPPANDYNFFNATNPQKGGSCGNSMCGLNMQGGSCGSCGLNMQGGRRKKNKKGGACESNNGIPYPNGLVGVATNPGVISSWPGVTGAPGDSNYYNLNKYHNDVSRQMINSGPAFPFVSGGSNKGRNKKSCKNKKGGGLSNFLAQDLINLGRQFKFGLGSAYNGLAGYSSPTNPLPWKGQLVNSNLQSLVKTL